MINELSAVTLEQLPLSPWLNYQLLDQFYIFNYIKTQSTQWGVKSVFEEGETTSGKRENGEYPGI